MSTIQTTANETTLEYRTPERIHADATRVLTELKRSIDTAGRRCGLATDERGGAYLLLPPSVRTLDDARWLLRLKGWSEDVRRPADVRARRYVLVRPTGRGASLDVVELYGHDGRVRVYVP